MQNSSDVIIFSNAELSQIHRFVQWTGESDREYAEKAFDELEAVVCCDRAEFVARYCATMKDLDNRGYAAAAERRMAGIRAMADGRVCQVERQFRRAKIRYTVSRAHGRRPVAPQSVPRARASRPRERKVRRATAKARSPGRSTDDDPEPVALAASEIGPSVSCSAGANTRYESGESESRK